MEHEQYTFSADCRDLAHTTPDGRICFRDAKLGSLTAEFIPTSHLSAAAKCIAWRPMAKSSPKKKNRKRKSSISSLTNGVTDLEGAQTEVGIGSASGSLLIYSLKTSNVILKEEKLHSDAINDLVWNSDGNEIYTASSDGHVGKFRLKPREASKFVPEEATGGKKKPKLTAIALHPSETSLIVGMGPKIVWIDLGTSCTLRTFSGHSGDVIGLRLFNITPESHFFSSTGASDKDHNISLWSLKSEEDSEKDCVRPEAVLNVNESVTNTTVSVVNENEAIVNAVSTSGVLYSFEFDAQSKRKKNKTLRPKITLQIASEKDQTSGKVSSISVLGAKLDEEKKLHLVHGDHVCPSIEALNYNKLDKITCLVRKTPVEKRSAATSNGPENGTKASNVKYAVPDSSTVEVLSQGVPSNVKPHPTSLASPRNETGTKRKTSTSDKVDELPMLERLRLLSKDGENIASPPRSESLLHLLMQGLHNQDTKILNTVLSRTEDELIDTTVRKLPLEAVIPLLQELQRFLKGRGSVTQSHAKWFKATLQYHSSYLMSNAHSASLMAPVYGMLEARTRHFSSLCRLKGKLDIMTKQITTKPLEKEAIESSKMALLNYVDDSSDEQSDIMDELLPPASDMEWNPDDDNDDDEEEDNEGESSDEEEAEDGKIDEASSSDEDEQENGIHGLENGGDESMDDSD